MVGSRLWDGNVRIIFIFIVQNIGLSMKLNIWTSTSTYMFTFSPGLFRFSEEYTDKYCYNLSTYPALPSTALAAAWLVVLWAGEIDTD